MQNSMQMPTIDLYKGKAFTSSNLFSKVDSKMCISSDDITIVMQGKILENKCIDVQVINNIRKVKKHFPKSKIIVSSWKMAPELQLQFSKLAGYLGISYLFNDDPGVTSKVEGGVKYVSNINRMIVSSLNGIRLAKTTFVIKMRTDSFFTSDSIFALLKNNVIKDEFKRDINYSVFNHRVLNYNLFSRNARGYLPYLFHPGDILFCGYKDDVMSIFNVDLANESIFKISKHAYFYSIMDYVPEQYIWIKCIEKTKGKVVFNGNSQRESKLIVESEMYYLNNFIPFNSRELGFCWQKHKSHYHCKGKYSVYDYSDWKRLYNKYYNGQPETIDRDFLLKFFVNHFMIIYFYLRSNLLQIPFAKRIALQIFNKRG